MANSMLGVTRRAAIKELILEQKSVTVTALSQKFSVADETIRRDLKTLEDEGLLTRVHGGAYIQSGALNDIDITLREGLFMEEKQQIAAQSAKLIHHGDSLFLDASTTSLFLARQICGMRVTVISNSLLVASALADSDAVKFIMIGGLYMSSSKSFVGSGATENLKRYYVDKAFLSCRSLDQTNGVTDSSEQQAQIRALAVERCAQAHLLADHTKFDKTSFVNICQIDALHALITNETLSNQWRTFLAVRNVLVMDEN